MNDRNYNDRHEPNAIERDRMARRQQTRRKSMLTNVLVIAVVVAIVVGIIIAIVAFAGQKKSDTKASETTAITETIASENADIGVKTTPKSQNATQPASSAPGAAAATLPSAEDSFDEQNNSGASSSQAYDDTSSSSADTSYDDSASSGSASIQGNSLHYTASGQTSYGYDWTYSGGGGIVSVACNYSFDSHQYDFVLTGVSPGTTSVTLYYNTADGVQVPVNMTVNVDNDLNVTQVG